MPGGAARQYLGICDIAPIADGCLGTILQTVSIVVTDVVGKAVSQSRNLSVHILILTTGASIGGVTGCFTFRLRDRGFVAVDMDAQGQPGTIGILIASAIGDSSKEIVLNRAVRIGDETDAAPLGNGSRIVYGAVTIGDHTVANASRGLSTIELIIPVFQPGNLRQGNGARTLDDLQGKVASTFGQIVGRVLCHLQPDSVDAHFCGKTRSPGPVIILSIAGGDGTLAVGGVHNIQAQHRSVICVGDHLIHSGNFRFRGF